MQVFKRFPLLHHLKYLAAPMAKLKVLSAMESSVRDDVLRRISRRGKTPHVDLSDHILLDGEPVPTEWRKLVHISSIAQQMVFANYGPVADWYYGTLLLLLDEPECLQSLCEYIRDKFESYNDIKPGALISLIYLNACVEESLHLLPSNNTGLPRLSPGAVVDGNYVPKGVSVFLLYTYTFSSLSHSCPLFYALSLHCPF